MSSSVATSTTTPVATSTTTPVATSTTTPVATSTTTPVATTTTAPVATSTTAPVATTTTAPVATTTTAPVATSTTTSVATNTPVTTASIIDAPVALIKQIIDLITLNDSKSQNGLFEISNLINTNLVQLLSTPSTQLFTSPVAFNGLQTLLNPNLNGLQTLLNPNLNGLQTLLNPNLNGLQTLLNPSQLPTIYTSLNSLVLMLEKPELKDKIKKLNVDISVLLKFFEENEEIRNFMDNLNKLREIVKVFKL